MALQGSYFEIGVRAAETLRASKAGAAQVLNSISAEFYETIVRCVLREAGVQDLDGLPTRVAPFEALRPHIQHHIDAGHAVHVACTYPTAEGWRVDSLPDPGEPFTGIVGNEPDWSEVQDGATWRVWCETCDQDWQVPPGTIHEGDRRWFVLCVPDSVSTVPVFERVSHGFYTETAAVRHRDAVNAEGTCGHPHRVVTDAELNRCVLCGNGPDDDSTNDVCLQGAPYGPMMTDPNGDIVCRPCWEGNQ